MSVISLGRGYQTDYKLVRQGKGYLISVSSCGYGEWIIGYCVARPGVEVWRF